jgi:arsenate reductase (thioredoxin)
MAGETRRILFLCTGNSARSVLAEALLNRMGEGRFEAFSAGSFPKGKIHPMALTLLGDKGFPTDELRSKSWDEFAGPGAPPLDVIITVCDNAAGETCPIWPGRPMTAHWGIADPAEVEGPGQRQAFDRAFDALKRRIAQLLALPLDGLDPPSLKTRLRAIGETQHA